ncbi:MAG: nucleotide exchange factor GrpE [Ostreibacterium sp.]
MPTQNEKEVLDTTEYTKHTEETDNTLLVGDIDVLGAAEHNEEQSVTDLQAELAEAKAKIAENWELLLSAKAEVDNIRKRAERDVSNAYKYALEKFIPDLLAVKDSLELGTKAAKESAESELGVAEQIDKFIEGSDMAITMFVDTLKKVGVTVINPENEVFNPELHQAVTMVPNSEIPSNTVIEVIQKGYTLNERLLRPAMVFVSKKP